MSGVETSDKPVPSPCISVCVLDMSDVCTGCFRTASEITQWTQYSNDERRLCNARALEREKELNPFL
jgi:predicted Fe-S protein YdhL (DUF1289 family)